MQVGVLSPFTFEGVCSDVAILNHVIEHLVNPEAVVREIRDHLKENGLLYIATPNFVCAETPLADAPASPRIHSSSRMVLSI